MKRFPRSILLLSVLFFGLTSCRKESFTIDLSGSWRFALDPQDVGISQQWENQLLPDTLHLPGSLQEQGKGYDIGIDTKWTGNIVDHSWYTAPEYEKYRQPGNIKVPFWLNPDKHYVGAAWYQRTIDIPAEWIGHPIMLELERTHWSTILYIDGKRIGEGESLQTPHRYVLNGLSAGEHTLTLRIDNRLLVEVGVNAHSVSDHTQSNWNGIIGRISLNVKPSLYIESMRIDPDIRTKQAQVTVHFGGDIGAAPATLILQAETQTGKRVGHAIEVPVATGSQQVEATVDLGADAQLWSEYTPVVYRMTAKLKAADGTDESQSLFGLREFKANGTRFEINGHPVFLRGTLECCIFPQTGYPAMEPQYWTKIFSKCQEYGLNHVRFHSWCPPEAAFRAADSMGMYLQVECGGWAEVGSGKPQDEWFHRESQRILREYGNHPSFCMMAYGNEPSGSNHSEWLNNLDAEWKSQDNRRIYTSAAGWPFVENSDYWNTPDPRIQAWGAGLNSIINREAPRTDYDFASIIRKDRPTVSHEIGQWCVYPNFAEIDKYTGVLKAKNLEIFRETLAEHGMADLSEAFLYASGRLQTLCYKADIEAALRTPGFAGFQLLDLHDFPGQGTALVGVLDPFWEEKGYVTGQEYSMFCNRTVPLVRFPKMVWLNNETLEAPIEFAHFGEQPLTATPIRWTVATADGRELASGELNCDLPIGNCIPAGSVRCDLSSLDHPSQLVVTVSAEAANARNQWNVWVYPAQKPAVEKQPYITTRLDQAALARLEAGESVLLLPYGTLTPEQGGDIAVGFSSIFWNTAWTNKQPPHTLGIYCDPAHPALASFPNQGVSDYQWWDLMSRCQAMNLTSYPDDFRPIVHIIDDWFTNRKLGLLYEARVGNGKLLVCSADLQNDLDQRPAAAQFRQSLLEYMASDSFAPTQTLPVETITGK